MSSRSLLHSQGCFVPDSLAFGSFASAANTSEVLLRGFAPARCSVLLKLEQQLAQALQKTKGAVAQSRALQRQALRGKGLRRKICRVEKERDQTAQQLRLMAANAQAADDELNTIRADLARAIELGIENADSSEEMLQSSLAWEARHNQVSSSCSHLAQVVH